MEKKLNGQAGVNGQPSMEEILASIRKIIAEEPMGSTPFPEPRLNVGTNARAEPIEEGGDFDLPSILRPSAQPSPEKHTPLFGRLADALRGASGTSSTASGPEAKPSKPTAEEPAPTVMKEPTLTQLSAAGEANVAQMSLSSLSSLRPEAPSPQVAAAPAPALDEERRKAEHPIPAPALRSGAMSAPRGMSSDSGPAPVPPRASGNEEVRRVMVPFRDQRMSMMGTLSPSPATSEDGQGAHGNGLDFGGIVPSDLHAAPVDHDHYNGFSIGQSADGDTAAASATALDALAVGLANTGLNGSHASYAAPDQPPAIPQAAAPPAAAPAGDANPSVKDAAAELLRPMLRQWLADNMPRIVEQALHIEVAESLKPPKK